MIALSYVLEYETAMILRFDERGRDSICRLVIARYCSYDTRIALQSCCSSPGDNVHDGETGYYRETGCLRWEPEGNKKFNF